MRLALHFDGLTADELRTLAAACSRLDGKVMVSIQCDGPEKFSALTPKLPIGSARYVAAMLNGERE